MSESIEVKPVEVTEEIVDDLGIDLDSAVEDEVEPEPMPEEPVLFYANRPFVYIIREASTNAILFVGRYTGK